jgi:hypothetical protein
MTCPLLVLLPIMAFQGCYFPLAGKALEVLWRLRPRGRGRGAIINDSIGGKELVLEAAVQSQAR